MKKITVAFLSLMLVAGTAFAQGKAAPWPEMKRFHSLMAGTFHPAEEGDLAPLKMKADSLYAAAKMWQASAIPADFKEKETKATLEKLLQQTFAISQKVEAKADDKELTKLITDAHDTFHKIAGECRKSEAHGAGDGHGH